MFDKQDSGAKRSSQHIAGKTMPPFKNDFQELLLEMRKVRGAVVTAFTDEESMLKAIYFQIPEMRNMFESYRELLLIDATYKLNDLNMPLYVLMSVDGMGRVRLYVYG